MRIVSQRRNYSFDFDRAVVWTQYEAVYAKIASEDIMIGKYATMERAAEVFEDMHRAYAPVGIITTNLSEEQSAVFIGSENVMMPIVRMDDGNAGITTYDSYLYYMPEK